MGGIVPGWQAWDLFCRTHVRAGRTTPKLVLHDSYTSEMTVSAARDDYAGAIERARRSGEPVYVTRRGHRLAVIVDADAYDALVEAR